MKIASIAFVIPLIATACAPSIEAMQPRQAEEAKFVFERGSNIISGNAKIVLSDGHVFSCHANGAILVPVTSYSKERMRILFGNTNRGYADRLILDQLPDDPLFFKFKRHADCDAAGRFLFSNVSDGEYFIQTDILWMRHRVRGNEDGGGALFAAVTVLGGTHAEVSLERLPQ